MPYPLPDLTMVDQYFGIMSIPAYGFLFVSPEMISAIAGLWIWGLLIAVVTVLFIFRAPLSQLVNSVVKLLENIVTRSEKADIALKAGQVEVEIKTAASHEIVAVATEQRHLQSEERPIEAAISSDITKDLVSQMFEAVAKRDGDEVDSIHLKLQEAETDPDRKIANEALYWYSRFEIGDKSALKKLEEFAQQHSECRYSFIRRDAVLNVQRK